MKLIIPKAGEPAAQPDPYLLEAEGKYYLYATGESGVEAYASDRPFCGWNYIGQVLKEEGMQSFWAPCVIERDGTYYMYYSSFPQEETDVHLQALKVATSSRPEGPFIYRKTVLPAFSIDPHVVKSGEDYYLFYSCNDTEAERAGTYIAVDRLTDMFTAEGAPVRVVVPTLDEEIFMRDRFRKGQHWHTIEGAFYFRKGNGHYVMYSGNCYQNEKYFVGYAYAESAESDLREVRFCKQPSDTEYAPLICKNAYEEGTGHNSVLRLGERYFAVYHARDYAEKAPYDTRTARVAELGVNGKSLTVKNRERVEE